MKHVLTILRRDLGAYFTSPIGYIFVIVFLIIGVGLYMTSFFLFPVADMRPFFANLPVLLCVFIPAVTMRIWAEERKENTWELLLTFPMKASELVLGKFLATLLFFAATLAATATVPLMLAALGDPDGGVIFSAYLGALLLGAFFLSMGIFFSGFCKDQIVAFVVTLLACFAVFLLGTGFISAYIDGMVPGLGSLLGQLVGVLDHYQAFIRGVIEVGDILYFAAWTALFLLLNVLYVDGRLRPKARIIFGAAVALCLVIGFLFNWLLTGRSFGRFDMTEDKVYTISDASKRILSGLDVPVQVKLYITPKAQMTTGLKNLEQDITDKLDEMRVASGGKVQYKTIHLSAAEALARAPSDTDEEDESEEETIEKRMLDKGIQPVSVQDFSSEDQVTNKLVYSSIEVAYREKDEEIIPRVMPQDLEQLEYRLVSTIFKLTQDERPVVALVAPTEAITITPEMRRLYEQMGQPVPQSDDPYIGLQELLRYEKYDVRRVELTQDSPLPDDYDTLVVVNPRSLNERQRWEINRALVSGKSVVMAVQNYEWDYRSTGRGISVNKRDENPQVNELLEAYGLGVDEDVLMDVNYATLNIQGGGLFGALFGQPVALPTHVEVKPGSMDAETSITSRLADIFYLWGSALTVDEEELKKHGLESKVIMRTTDQAWTVPEDGILGASAFEPPKTGRKTYPLMAMVTGQFPDAFKNESRPEWPEEPPAPGQPPRPPRPVEEPEAGPVTPAPGKLVLLGCSEMFRRNFIQQGGAMDLFMNSVDGLTLGEDLIHVRGKKPVNRTIDKPSAASRRLWKVVNYALASTTIAAIGIVVAVLRRRARNAYAMKYAAGS